MTEVVSCPAVPRTLLEMLPLSFPVPPVDPFRVRFFRLSAAAVPGAMTPPLISSCPLAADWVMVPPPVVPARVIERLVTSPAPV